LGVDAPVGVVEPAEHGYGDEFRRADELRWLGVGDRRVAVEALLRPRGVIIGLNEFGEQPFEMALVQDDHAVEQFSAESPNESFDIGILPGTVIGGPHFLDTATIEEGAHAVAVAAVVVAEEVAGLDAVGHGFAKLLHDPSHGGRRRDGPVQGSAAAVFE
jgi:hypothetical protein